MQSSSTLQMELDCQVSTKHQSPVVFNYPDTRTLLCCLRQGKLFSCAVV